MILSGGGLSQLMFQLNYRIINLKEIVFEVGAGGGLASAYLSSFEQVDRVDCLDYSLTAVEKLMPEVQSSIDITNPKNSEGLWIL